MSDMNESRDDAARTAPDFLTVEEAAEVLRLGRTAAYKEARKYEASHGATGIPVERFGKQFRVPRCKIEERLGGPITWPLRSQQPAVEKPVASATSPTTRSRATRRRSPRDEQTPRLFPL